MKPKSFRQVWNEIEERMLNTDRESVAKVFIEEHPLWVQTLFEKQIKDDFDNQLEFVLHWENKDRQLCFWRT